MSNLLNILSALSNLPFCRQSMCSGARGGETRVKGLTEPRGARVSPGVTAKQLTDPDQVEEHVAWGGVVAAVHEPGLRHLLVAGLRHRGRPVRAGWGGRNGPRRKPREPRPHHIPAPGFS